MFKLRQKYRNAQITGFDRWIRFRDPERLARSLTEASRSVTKRPHVVLVEPNVRYGNLRALALELKNHLAYDEFTYLAYGPFRAEWARANDIQAAHFSLDPSQENVELWEKLFRSSISVYENHDWWRSREQMLKRALLAGSKRIQLWHGSAGPVGKEIALGRLNAQPAFWHFAAVATTSVGWDYLVCEPNFDEERRLDRVQAPESIHDVEFRLANVMNTIEWSRPELRKILVAPTFPETAQGERLLVEWIKELGRIGQSMGVEVEVKLHPASKKWLRKEITKISSITPKGAGVPSELLMEVDLVVTDFSSIAHDSLLLGVPTMMVTPGIDEYTQNREIFFDQEQWDCCYIAASVSELSDQVHAALEEDPKKSARDNYRNSLVSALGARPGENTVQKILQLLGKLD